MYTDAANAFVDAVERSIHFDPVLNPDVLHRIELEFHAETGLRNEMPLDEVTAKLIDREMTRSLRTSN